MSHCLSLIANPAGPPLLTDHVTGARDALGGAGARVNEPDWLAPTIACDLPFAGAEPIAAERAVRAALAGAPIDLAVQRHSDRRKRVLVADMDSTIINVECIDELADHLGIKPRIAAITERAMRGELDFASALKERVALLAGLSEGVIETIWRERVRLNPGARELVLTMRAGGARTLLVSGGFKQFTARVRDAAGFDEDHANTLIIEGGHLTGRVGEPILGAEAKLERLKTSCAALGLGPEAALAVGDGANDATMIKVAGLGVAYHAKPILKSAANAVIDHGDLTALLYLQGYRRAEFRR